MEGVGGGGHLGVGVCGTVWGGLEQLTYIPASVIGFFIKHQNILAMDLYLQVHDFRRFSFPHRKQVNIQDQFHSHVAHTHTHTHTHTRARARARAIVFQVPKQL